MRGKISDARRSYLNAAKLDPRHPEVLNELYKFAPDIDADSRGELLALLDDIARPQENSSNQVSKISDYARASIEDLALALRQQGQVTHAEALERFILTTDVFSSVDDNATSGTLPAPNDAQVLVFDVSDLLSYFRNARLPTGIQRVQIETIAAILHSGGAATVKICAFAEHREEWVEVSCAAFQTLAQLSLANGDRTAPEWLSALTRLQLLMNLGEALEFPDGAFLINLGTSWWLQNYFLSVRHAKTEHRIRYVPFVHDLIPVMAAEHCTKELTQDFISWVIGAFDHADFFLVNSEATKKDLLTVAARLGHQLQPDRVAVIRLNADFRKPAMAQLGTAALAKWGLNRISFVLFVSTVESRKNHLGAFDAWIELIRRHGVRDVPKLVCVGNRGWLNDAVYARLNSHEDLKDRVLMLSGLSDAELALLYRSCLFTLYPSRYEGWGLPITESLCYGKVALASDTSSLPEAGGDFAVYFESGSIPALVDGLERLIYDASYRGERERKILQTFKPRSWREVTEDIVSAIASWSEVNISQEASLPAVPAAQPGAYHPFVRNFETRIWSGMRSGEIFRAGLGWWWPDNWGCWTKPQGGRLEIGMPDARGAWRLYLRLHGLPNCTCAYEVRVADTSITLEGVLAAQAYKWLTLELPVTLPNRTVSIFIQGTTSQELAAVTDGVDRRVVSVGVCGFFLCEADDAVIRSNFLEAVVLGNVDDLAFNREPSCAVRRTETV